MSEELKWVGHMTYILCGSSYEVTNSKYLGFFYLSRYHFKNVYCSSLSLIFAKIEFKRIRNPIQFNLDPILNIDNSNQFETKALKILIKKRFARSSIIQYVLYFRIVLYMHYRSAHGVIVLNRSDNSEISIEQERLI